MTTRLEILTPKGKLKQTIIIEDAHQYDHWFGKKWVGFLDLFGATSAATMAQDLFFKPATQHPLIAPSIGKPERPEQHGVIVHQATDKKARNPIVSIVQKKRNGELVTLARFQREPRKVRQFIPC